MPGDLVTEAIIGLVERRAGTSALTLLLRATCSIRPFTLQSLLQVEVELRAALGGRAQCSPSATAAVSVSSASTGPSTTLCFDDDAGLDEHSVRQRFYPLLKMQPITRRESVDRT